MTIRSNQWFRSLSNVAQDAWLSKSWSVLPRAAKLYCPRHSDSFALFTAIMLKDVVLLYAQRWVHLYPCSNASFLLAFFFPIFAAAISCLQLLVGCKLIFSYGISLSCLGVGCSLQISPSEFATLCIFVIFLVCKNAFNIIPNYVRWQFHFEHTQQWWGWVLFGLWLSSNNSKPLELKLGMFCWWHKVCKRGERQKKMLSLTMDFVLVHSKGAGRKSCKHWQPLQDPINVGRRQAHT